MGECEGPNDSVGFADGVKLGFELTDGVLLGFAEGVCEMTNVGA